MELLVPVNSENISELSRNHFSGLNIKRFIGYVPLNDFLSLIDKVVAFEKFSSTRRVADLLLLHLQNVVALFDHTY